MAKMTRRDLKIIVKECLVEIFNEMGTQLIESKHAPAGRSAPRRSANARATAETQRLSRVRQALDSRRADPTMDTVAETVSTVTNDPLLSRILTDTAQTTMLEQHAAEHAGPGAIQGDAAARAMHSADPLDLFGDSASNWANLAFSEKKGM